MSKLTTPESDYNYTVDARGIKSISVSGYKSLYEECSIEVRPLTILAGANSSGKSSIMQPLLLLKQTLEATYDPGSLLLNGPNVKFTSVDQILSKISGKPRTDSFTLQINLDVDIFLISTFSKNQKDTKKQKKVMGVANSTYYFPDGKVTITPEMSHQELVKILPEWLDDDYQKMLDALDEEELPQWSVSTIRSFLDFKLGEPSFIPSRFSLSSDFQEHIRHIIHVPGLRGNPERTYNTTAVDREFTGTFENYVASIINHWQNTADNRLIQLEANLKKLGLTNKLDARQINDVQIELRVSRLVHSTEANDMVSIADVGLGVSQTLPILVALLVAEPGQLVYLEQPEIHLHPRAQATLAEILADAANRGVKVVVETHSDLLLRRIQSLVAEGKILPEIIKLHWFTRNDDGITKVSSADLDDAGAFGDWPEDFSDVALAEESRYLDAAESRLVKRLYVS